jgi:hypothetical protein
MFGFGMSFLAIWLICFFGFVLFKEKKSPGERKASILFLRGKRKRAIKTGRGLNENDPKNYR